MTKKSNQVFNVDILDFPSYKAKTVLELINIEKRHGSQTTLQKLSLRVEEGEFFSLLGPSGCGKTTLLRILSGFESPTSGEIYFCGKRIDHLAPQDRPFNIVFQSYALFPHLTVYDNIAFGLRIKMREKNKEEIIKKKVTDILETIGLEELGDRLPETLSGGQAQRVALARALVNEPKLLLLDEPLSALDAKMRESMQRELRALQQRLGITFIFVTHDQEEALTLSDRVAVMNKGVIEQMSSPRDLYENPKSCFVARFMGSNNELCGEVIDFSSIKNGEASPQIEMKVDGGPSIYANRNNVANVDKWSAAHRTEINQFVSVKSSSAKSSLANKAVAFIRPERIRIYTDLDKVADQNCLKGVITNIIFRGQNNEIQVDCDDLGVFKLITKTAQEIELGADVYIGFDPSDTMMFGIDE